jgi:hypothetical protein
VLTKNHWALRGIEVAATSLTTITIRTTTGDRSWSVDEIASRVLFDAGPQLQPGLRALANDDGKGALLQLLAFRPAPLLIDSAIAFLFEKTRLRLCNGRPLALPAAESLQAFVQVSGNHSHRPKALLPSAAAWRRKGNHAAARAASREPGNLQSLPELCVWQVRGKLELAAIAPADFDQTTTTSMPTSQATARRRKRPAANFGLARAVRARQSRARGGRIGNR